MTAILSLTIVIGLGFFGFYFFFFDPRQKVIARLSHLQYTFFCCLYRIVHLCRGVSSGVQPWEAVVGPSLQPTSRREMCTLTASSRMKQKRKGVVTAKNTAQHSFSVDKELDSQRDE